MPTILLAEDELDLCNLLLCARRPDRRYVCPARSRRTRSAAFQDIGAGHDRLDLAVNRESRPGFWVLLISGMPEGR